MPRCLLWTIGTRRSNRGGDARTAGELARPLPTLSRDDTLPDALAVMREAGAYLAAVAARRAGSPGVVVIRHAGPERLRAT